MRFHCLMMSWLLSIVSSAVSAHPVSHTDAWAKVSDHVDVKLSVFLDDIVRHQIGPPEDHDLISSEDLQQAILRHTDLIPAQLRIFDQHGRPLTPSVTAVPDWQPRHAEVKLSDNNLLKLTWRLRYASDDPALDGLKALCFLHSFTHPDLTDAGELRMHVQDVASGNRIDAVIPPALPHTMLLPHKGSAISPSAAEANGAMSRLIMSPAGIVHEFTAPLLFLDDVWPDAKTLREQSLFPGSLNATVAIDNADVAIIKQKVEAWMRSNVQLRVGQKTVPFQEMTVDFFPAGQTPDEQLEDTPVSSTALPLFGTQVGVRMQFPGGGVSQPMKLIFNRSPGLFDSLTVEVTSRVGQMSQLIAVSPDSSQPAFLFEWAADAVVNGPMIDPTAASKLIPQTYDPLSVKRTRPGVHGLCYGIVGFVLCVGVGYLAQSVSLALRYVSYTAGGCVFIASLLLISDSEVVVDRNQVTKLTSQILTGVYHGAMSSSEDEAVNALSRVLQDDLVEDVYLSTLNSLSLSPENGVIIDVGEVDVDLVQVLPPESEDRLSAKCRWNVHGIVQHWGHSHSRELLLEGDLTMIRDGQSWKLLSISQTESTKAAVQRIPRGMRAGKSRASDTGTRPDA